MSNIEKNVTSGFLWINLSRYVSTFINFAGGIYLARQIDPVYFGQQGLAFAYLSIIFVLGQFGQEYDIIRSSEDEVEKVAGTHMSIRIGLIALVGLSLLVIYLFRVPLGLDNVYIYLFALYLSQSPSEIISIYGLIMSREMLFKRLAFIDLTSSVISMTTACILAYYDVKVWALVWLLMAQHISTMILNFILCPRRFCPKFDKKTALKSFHYGKHVFLYRLFSRSYAKLDDVAVGSLVNQTALGFYQRAYGLSGYLQQLLFAGITAVTGPYFGKISADSEGLGKKFQFVGNLIVRVAISGYCAIAIVLPELIEILYGKKWLPTVPLFRLLLPFAIVQSISMYLVNTQLVRGESSAVSRSSFAALIVLLIFMFPLLHFYKAAGVAIAVDISAIVSMALLLWYMRAIMDFSIRKLFAAPLIAASAGIICWLFLSSYFIVSGNLIMKLVTNLSIFGISYLAILILVDYAYLRDVCYLFKNRLLT
ncbi:MAG: hypothetical protein C4560_08605 [Nitrospiraceae bacterium]|nr:MAG: hypothetical protein C4560_08605 [Nitrospiraceae bacterium]